MDDHRYRFDPLDRSGFLFGLDPTSAAIAAVFTAAAIAAVAAGVPVAVAGAAMVVPALAAARTGGHRGWQWLALGATWLATKRTRRWRAPLTGVAFLPPPLEGVEVVSIDDRLGAVVDHAAATATIVASVEGSHLQGHDADHQHDLLGRWAAIVAGFAADPTIAAISWTHHARPATATTLPATDSDAAVLAAATTHRVHVALTVADRASAATRPARLRQAAERLARVLDGADLSPRLAAAAELVALARAHAEPFHRRPAPTLARRLHLDPSSAPPRPVGPLAAEVGWSEVLIDGAWHRSWWIEAWPPMPVAAAWLQPLLGAISPAALTIVLAPEPAGAARRRIQRDLVKFETTAESRAARGHHIDATHRKATQALVDREHELAAGHAEVAYLGLVTIAAPTLADLDARAAALADTTAEVGVGLRVLHGRQLEAWAATLGAGMAPKATGA